MIHKDMKNKSILVAGLFLAFTVFAPSALALGKPILTGKPSGTPSGQFRLGEAKLKVCQARENVIKNRTEQLVNLVTNMEEKFDAISGRVETYYTSKVVPSGKTVANYDSLVADINNKKAAVGTALTTAQNAVTGFSCTSSDPKGQLTQFRQDMQAVKSALKDYRTSIKNLIVAVRSVTGQTESDNKTTPKPTKTGGEGN